MPTNELPALELLIKATAMIRDLCPPEDEDLEYCRTMESKLIEVQKSVTPELRQLIGNVIDILHDSCE